jgi:hypothetical protein
MGLFAFRRMRELEAASNEAASFSIAEPKLTVEDTTNASSNRRNSGGRKRQLVSDAGSSSDDN